MSYETDDDGYFAYQDPLADKRRGWVSWVEGAVFTDAVWSCDNPSVVISLPYINTDTVSIGGKSYAAGKVASAKISGVPVDKVCTISVLATFDNGDVDRRTFRLIGRSGG